MNGSKLKTYKLTALSAWALYLINGDSSGLESGEETTINDWLKFEGVPGMPVDCEDGGFRWRHDASNYSLAGDCQIYTWLIPPNHALYDVAE